MRAVGAAALDIHHVKVIEIALRPVSHVLCANALSLLQSRMKRETGSSSFTVHGSARLIDKERAQIQNIPLHTLSWTILEWIWTAAIAVARI